MDPEETDTFVRYSRSMLDLASIFKLAKKEKSLDRNEKVELLKKKNFKRNQIELSKMIFGVGMTPKEMKNKTLTFRIVPSQLVGFSKVQ
jgi:regulatory protein YycH of two-component signal transduction system YycFG